jgi:hypothetical protein
MTVVINSKYDFSEYTIFGISSHLPTYKICWTINKQLDLEFKHFPSLVNTINDTNLEYKMYSYIESEHLTYYLISNIQQAIPWLQQAKHFQYFFIFQGTPLPSQKKEIFLKLKQIPNILLVQELNISELKYAAPLLENFELHVTSIMEDFNQNKTKNLLKKYKRRK